jgi:spermidine synthase
MNHRQRETNVIPAWLFTALIVVAAGTIAFGALLEPTLAAAVKGAVALFLVPLVVAALYAASAPPMLLDLVDRSTVSLERLIAAVSGRRLTAAIVLASSLGLYFELFLIRWHASSFQLFAYYKNVTLIACFLGLGIGFALTSRGRIWLVFVVPALAVQVVLLRLLRNTPLATLLNNPVPGNVALGLNENTLVGEVSDPLPGLLISYGFLTLVFVATALTLMPLGQITARLMRRMSELPAYGLNLMGSIFGVVAFTLLAHLWAPPAVWLVLGVTAALPFLVVERRMTVAAVTTTVVAIGVLVLSGLASDEREVYSPYQILFVHERPGDPPVLLVNHTYFQRALDLSASAVANDPQLERRARYYELAFLIKPSPGAVLVLGSGLGNDVAAALRRGSSRVEAVEIDPAILELGRVIHPERPYSDEKVTTTVTDARRFIRRSEQRFDVILYGLLDSHSMLSANTSVRLDSFVYTVEAFREARSLLTDDGILVLSFSLMSQEQGEKLYRMLSTAFDGEAPRILLSGYDRGFAFVVGSGLEDVDPAVVSGFQDVTEVFANPNSTVDLATDDWPFFYMPRRAVPLGYGALIAVLLTASLVLSARVLQSPGRLVPSLPCFFLGAGFMLIETRSITELGLLYGSTWQVVSITIVAVLIMAFAANFIIFKRGSPPIAITYGLLVLSLVVGLAAGGGIFRLSGHLELLVRTAIITLPLFFSGFAFSSEIHRSGNVAGALSSNLLGAVFGGFLEYASMRFGFQALYVIGGIIYIIAFVTTFRRSTPFGGSAKG